MELVDEVGLVISATKPDGLSRITSPDRHCSFVGFAREGRTFYAQNEDISCPLARFNLGLDEVTPERLGELAKTLIPMLTGKPNISLGCGGSRPHARLAPDQMFLAMPIEVYRLLCSSAEAAW